jgi:hypothetical protein
MLRLDPDAQDAIKAIRRLEQAKAAPGVVRKTRVALVIGNADYKYGGRLANPVNDASDLANILRRLDFEVIEGRNLDKRGMDEKIAEFARKLEKAGIGLFFYAGHAIQIDGDNWLIPIDAPIEGRDLRPDRAAALKTATINIGLVLSKMEAEQRINLVFLDACRDNPFGRSTGLGQAKGWIATVIGMAVYQLLLAGTAERCLRSGPHDGRLCPSVVGDGGRNKTAREERATAVNVNHLNRPRMNQR